MIGKTLAHYRITAKLGQGGMGEVFLADDSTLERKVALKFLPDAFAGDPERVARFEREARLLASLNHPNIAAIHGLEQADGQHFIVMELAEGETLARSISRSPLPLDEALAVCRQIAEGVEAAHEKGIIHRDLKPSNVMVAGDGRVKILDFGLARLLAEGGIPADSSSSPTVSATLTRPGVALGTPAYMSPEQAMGKVVDRRADIWAFGCILYECLAGKRAFTGESSTEIIASILKSDPDWHALPRRTPEALRAVLKRCLQKEPRSRLHDIADAWMEIEDAVSTGAKVEMARRPGVGRWLLVAGLLPLAGVLLAVALMYLFRPSAKPLTVRSVIKVEPGHGLAATLNYVGRPRRGTIAISRDGSYIVYSAAASTAEARPQLYLRRTGESEARPIAGTEGGSSPFLSPDDGYVGFAKDGKLWKTPIGGGIPVPLCDSPDFGASWGPDNSIVFSGGVHSGLLRVSAEGGTPEVLTPPERLRQPESHRLPFCLPHGKGALFTIMAHPWDLSPRVAVLDYETRRWQVLVEDASDPRYLPGGYLLFLRRGTLMAVRFDEDRMQTSGTPKPVVPDVMDALNDLNGSSAAGQFAVSPSGSIVYATGGIFPDLQNELLWVDKSGSMTPAVAEKKSYLILRLSPDGSKIAYSLSGLQSGVWIYDIGRRTHIPLTEVNKGGTPVWWDDSRLVFTGGPLEPSLFWRAWDRSNDVQRVTRSDHEQRPQSWHPDRRTLALLETHRDTGYDICFFDSASGRVTPRFNSKANETQVEWSPDGRYLAYVSDETGQRQVWIQSVVPPDSKRQVSRSGGGGPVWSRDGRQLFFQYPFGVTASKTMWVVVIRADASEPRPFLSGLRSMAVGYPTRCYDLSRDGRFLMVKMEQPEFAPVTEMVLVQNWFEEVRRLLATGRD